MKKQALFIVLLTFLALNNSQLYSTSKNQAVEGSSLKLNTADPFYSVDYSNSSSEINVFSIYDSNQNLSFINYTIDNATITNSAVTTIPKINLIQQNASITAMNYFISNNNRFLVLLSQFINKSHINIYNLDTNKSFSLNTTLAVYSIPFVTRLSNSPDVYFCIHGSNDFLIIKYSFSNDSFSVFFKKVFSDPSFIRHADVYKLDDKIYCSLVIRQNTTSDVFNSNIYILNSKGAIYSKLFNNLEVYSFSQTDTGLFLETSLNGYFYMYNYTNDSMSKTNLYFGSMPSTLIRPFSNNSLFILNNEQIEIINVNNSVRGTTFETLYYYYLPATFTSVDDPTLYPLSPYALDLSSGNHYLLGSMRRGNESYVISINKINDPPQGFAVPSETYTCYHCDYPLLSGAGTGFALLGVAYHFFQQIINLILILGEVFIIITIFLIISIFIIIPVKYKKSKNSVKKIKSNNLPSVNGFQNYCTTCGSPIEKGSIFCVNCGKKIKKFLD